MGIKQVWSDKPQQPRLMRLQTTDPLASVQTAGYLNDASNWDDENNADTTFLKTDRMYVVHDLGSSSEAVSALQSVSIANDGTITLADA